MRGWSKGRIPWPLGHPGGKYQGRNSFIVCGDLVRAIQSEANVAVQYWWGVQEKKVTVWRRALGVGASTDGTHRLRHEAEMTPERLAMWRKAQTKAVSFDVMEKRREVAEIRGYYRSNALPWPEENVALLGTMSDRLLGLKLGLATEVVNTYRRKLGIPAFHEEQGIRTAWAGNRIPLSKTKFRERRITMGLTQTQVAERAGMIAERLHYYEKIDGRWVNRQTLESLAEALECNPAEIVHDGWDLDNLPAYPVDRNGVSLTAEQIHPLKHGPYAAPDVKVGDSLVCQLRGRQIVKKFSDGPIPWPMADGPGNSYIVCGDLVRAIQNEANHSVAYWWGVMTHTVTRWRRALDITK